MQLINNTKWNTQQLEDLLTIAGESVFGKLPDDLVVEIRVAQEWVGGYACLGTFYNPGKITLCIPNNMEDQIIFHRMIGWAFIHELFHAIHNFDHDGNISYEKLTNMVDLFTSDGCSRKKKVDT